MSADTATTVSILIASLGRPSLLKTLDSVDRTRVPEGCTVEIVIVDDSVDGQVANRLEGRQGRHPIRIVELGARNVAAARNALLDAATGEWGLFVDDDEFVDEGWLAGHLSAARDFDAEVVFGLVHFVYPPSTEAWYREADLMACNRDWEQDGRPAETGATNNTLVRMEAVRRHGLRFDPRFGRSGGEDWDFFARMGRQGCRMVLTNRAQVWEDVSEARANPDYLLERSLRTGHTYARYALAGASRPKRMGFAVNALAKLGVAGTATLLAWPFGPAQRYRFQAMTWSNLGKLGWLLGRSEDDGWANEV